MPAQEAKLPETCKNCQDVLANYKALKKTIRDQEKEIKRLVKNSRRAVEALLTRGTKK